MEISRAQRQFFTNRLMDWHRDENTRSLPWKNEKDPYRIWLSEIILQQTRAEQGLPYYNAFTNAYPTVKHLAEAADEDVFRLWQGLGYYNRCRNLLFTARYITKELRGRFPETFEDLLKLKGIGTYTAAAIASFAYGLPHAVVDGNVYRVLARYLGIDLSSDSTAGKQLFARLASELLDKNDSAGYNQAIMDLGATVCTPKLYKCEICPLQKQCVAFNGNIVDLLPVRDKKVAVKNRYFNYILFICGGKTWIKKREGKDIWQNLYELFLIETESALDADILKEHAAYKTLKLRPVDLQTESSFRQKLTHQLIYTTFYCQHIQKPDLLAKYEGIWVNPEELKNFGFPKTIVSFLEKKLYF